MDYRRRNEETHWSITMMQYDTLPFDYQVDDEVLTNGVESLAMSTDDEDPRNPKQFTTLLVASLDNKNWRIYLNSTTWVGSPEYINKFCRFMDTRSEDMTVDLYLGAWANEIASLQIGSILRSIENCKAKVTTIANGYCGLVETIMWVHGHERRVGKYGGLKFSGSEFIRNHPNCASYIRTFLKKCIELNVLKQDQVDSIVNKNQEILLVSELMTVASAEL